uniref:Terpene synthase 3 n=1 Tax=Copaifera langsdorffii TaxID=280048 RepID=U3MSP8_COPLA|nr:terpene synthase 3 [Copaifera langsdorffii]
MATEVSEHVALSSIQNADRPLVKYVPSIWGDFFLQYASEFMEVDDNMKQKVGVLKEEVRRMLVSSVNHNFSRKLDFIDSIQRLGVSYHFQHEIDEALKQIHDSFTNNGIITPSDHDLHSIALLFRLLRQQGYHVSSGIFIQYKDQNGNFNEKLRNDVRGMLSLYEAAQLRIDGDDILAEALDFTSTQLKLLSSQLGPSLVTEVEHSLRLPLHKTLPRIEARHYMSFYQDDPSHNEILLTFAKLDFDMLQKLHQNEIGNITKWWKKSDCARRVPYGRDRLVESYFWPLSISHEPQYSIARSITGKLVAVLALLDDTYDAYGTVQELELFTEAIKRWDASLINFHPEGMKAVFGIITELCNEIESVIANEGKLNFITEHVKHAIYNLAQAYLTETKWGNEGYIPTYSEYKSNGVATSTYPLEIICFVSLTTLATKEVLNWISSDPEILKATSIIGRLLDDMASHKFEQERIHVASSVECCMKQYGISEEEAYKVLHDDITHYWNVLNEESLKLMNVVPKAMFEFLVNLARVSEVAYEKYQDGYTKGEFLKKHVDAVIVNPIP